MSDYDNEKKGVLFKNEKKQKETDPLYTGSITIEGVEYWLSSWVNTSKNGKSYMSLSATVKVKKEEYQAQQPVDNRPIDDDIFF